ncbi:hypothetical protein WR25_10431 [Diploscapter pachys]|uniref:F-box domain-containing protein n=1 Tax=Diploscapter pachys TaxID=2018661 RepID=A0A2A2JLS0_9BILA|nr:hypothetical protein WR25_10431 [Diploscapter pachys]
MDAMFSADFLESLLSGVDLTRAPLLFDVFPESHAEELTLDKFPKPALVKIAEFVPLKERVKNLSAVCSNFHSAVKESVTAVNFYKDGLDTLSDSQLKYFLTVYGSTVKHLNFDLFRASKAEECSQWNWRQTVLDCVALCRNVEQITAIVCNRHRVRDNDIMKLQSHCPQLKALVVDGYFIKGHSFKIHNLWRGLEKLQIDFCYRFSAGNLLFAMNLFKNLKVLHLSQPVFISNSAVEAIVNMRQLQELSLIASPDLKFQEDLTSTGLSQLRFARSLKMLALDGVSVVDDEFLQTFCQPSSPVVSTLKSLSLAFCRNFTAHGILHLVHLKLLENLNLDGVTQDVGPGLTLVSQKLNFERLYLAEKTCIDPSTLLKIVIENPKLKLLDLTDNHAAVDQFTAFQIAATSCYPDRSKLVVVTDLPNPWWEIYRYPSMNLRVVYLHRRILFGSIPAMCLIDNDSIGQLPQSLLLPDLRRGNRYRLLYAALGSPYPKESENKENTAQGDSPRECSPNDELLMTGIPIPPSIYDFVSEYVCLEILNALSNTNGGGAPRPRPELPEMPRAIVRYTRSSHLKRRSHPPTSPKRGEHMVLQPVRGQISPFRDQLPAKNAPFAHHPLYARTARDFCKPPTHVKPIPKLPLFTETDFPPLA